MSVIRSSRARSTQLPVTTISHGNSTAQSKDSKTRVANIARSDSLGRGSLPRSESFETSDNMSRAEQAAAPRRSRRGAEHEREPPPRHQAMDYDENEAIEDEITRCVCGHADYPGPSVTIRDKYGPAAITEEMGNFFVQCDSCHVWQHGGCLSLHDESIIPDEYYCEKCKPEYHKIIKAGSIGTKSSRYLPVLEGLIPGAVATPENSKSREAKNRLLQNTKRRATMNSRGAYDEDEALRQAIEESKHDDTLGKRGRDDSADRRPSGKRQRTSTSNSDNASDRSQSPDGEKTGLQKTGAKSRGNAVRTIKEKEIREKQKQEAAATRAEAASKRNARSERRRADDSPPPTPTISPVKLADPRSGRAKVDTPQPAKTKGRGGARVGVRSKKLGRNQYTRDLYDPSDGRDPKDNAFGSPYANGEGSRARAKIHPARISMNEMRKRVAAITEFVSQVQIQANTGSSGSKNLSDTNGSGDNSRNSSTGKGNSTPNGTQITSAPSSKLAEAVSAGLDNQPDENFLVDNAEFNKMSSQEMAETLTKELVAWQQKFGTYSK